jgi:hypothetical protein
VTNVNDIAALVDRLHARLVTVPRPGAQPFTPTGSIAMSIGGGPHKPGDDAGLQTIYNHTGAAIGTQPWRVQEHVYAGEPLAYEAAAALTAQARRIAELESGYAEAIEDIESWAGYASEYFQDKHDLPGCLAGHRAALSSGKGSV